MTAKLAIAAVALALTMPTAAAADVLIEVPKSRPSCGAAISVGIWAQSWTTGSRYVLMYATDVRSGHIFWTKRATAYFSRWRYWYLPSGWKGYCRATRITYALLASHGAIWRRSFTVRFRPENA